MFQGIMSGTQGHGRLIEPPALGRRQQAKGTLQHFQPGLAKPGFFLAVTSSHL